MLVFVIIPLYSILSLKASKVLGNGIWGFIEALCHYEVEMAAFIRSSPAFFLSSSPTFLGLGESSIFKRFLENQKCIRIHIRLYLLLLATYNM